MKRNWLKQFWPITLMTVMLALPFVSGCGSPEEPKTPEQIEESRLRHIEASRKEHEGRVD